MKTRRIRVSEPRPYTVFVGRDGVLDHLYRTVSGRVFVLSDPTVWALYESFLRPALGDAHVFVTEGGETSKNMTTLLSVLTALDENNFTRTDTLVAVGGGTVCDVGALAASLYRRGMRLVLVPTTLLAMVDAAVGGKTGVDFNGKKNSVGTFYAPEAVVCDTVFLDTLPPDVLSQGLAEVVKTAYIGVDGLLALVRDGFVRHEEEIISACVRFKAALVKRDVYDRGERHLLNAGHTVGHAIERASGYKVPHGYAVAMGLCVETRAAVAAGLVAKSVLRELEKTLCDCGLPTTCPYGVDELCPFILDDKKSDGDTLTFALLCGLVPVKTEHVRRFLEGGGV